MHPAADPAAFGARRSAIPALARGCVREITCPRNPRRLARTREVGLRTVGRRRFPHFDRDLVWPHRRAVQPRKSLIPARFAAGIPNRGTAGKKISSSWSCDRRSLEAARLPQSSGSRKPFTLSHRFEDFICVLEDAWTCRFHAEHRWRLPCPARICFGRNPELGGGPSDGRHLHVEVDRGAVFRNPVAEAGVDAVGVVLAGRRVVERERAAGRRDRLVARRSVPR